MSNKNNCGANEALKTVQAIQARASEAQNNVHRLKGEIYNIPSWCNADSVVPLIEKLSTSTKRVDEMIADINDLVEFLKKYIDVAYIGNNAEIVELMNSQKIEF